MKKSLSWSPLFLLFGLIVLISGCGEQLTDAEYLAQAKTHRNDGAVKAAEIALKNALQVNAENPEARYLLGLVYLNQLQGESAEKELLRAQELGVSTTGILVPLAQSLQLQNQPEALVERIHVASDLSPDDLARIHWLRGDALLELERDNEAEREFQRAQQAAPTSLAALLGQALWHFHQQQLPEARVWLNKALTASPDDLDTLRLQSKLSLAEQDYALVEATNQHILELYPRLLPPRLTLAIAQLAQDNLDEAIKNLDHILKSNAQHVEANHYRAVAAFQQSEYETAKLHAETALNRAPNLPPAQMVAGAANYALGNYEQAFLALNGLVGRHPNHTVGRRLLAATQLRLGATKEAADVLAEGENQTEDAPLLAAVAQELMRGGDLEQGQRLLEQAATLQPENIGPRIQLGLLNLTLGDTEQGLASLEELAATNPDIPEAKLALLQGYLQDQDFQQALTVSEELQQEQADQPIGWVSAGIAHLNLGQSEAAREAFTTALEVDPGNTNASHQLALFAIADKDITRAQQYYQDASQANPDDIQIRLYGSGLALQTGQYQQAVNYLEQILERSPETVEPYQLLGAAYLEASQVQKALETAQTGLDRFPEDIGLLGIQGSAELQLDRYDDAVASLRQVTQRQPGSAEAQQLLAQALRGQGNIQTALEVVERALAINPDHSDALVQKTGLLLQSGAASEAATLVAHLEQVANDHPQLPLLKSGIALAQDRPNEAIALLEQQLEQDPESSTALLLAQAYWQSTEPERGEQLLRDWLVQHPDDLSNHFFLARHYALTGQSDEAIKTYQDMLEGNPDYFVGHNNLAWLLYQTAQLDSALEHAERARELSPQHPAVMNTLGVILLALDRSVEALPLLARAAERLPRNKSYQFSWAQALHRNGDDTNARQVLEALLQDSENFPEQEEAKKLLEMM